MAAVTITFPAYPSSTFIGFDTFAACRAYAAATELANGFNSILDSKATLGDGLGGIFAWDGASVAADNDSTILAPTGVSTGRWIKTATGSIGPVGPAPTLAIGTVSTLSTGSSATASVSGGSGAYTLNLGLPTGATGSGATVAWGGVTGTLSSQTDLDTALGLKAPLASPTLTGTPAAPTAAASTNTTQIATTAFVDASFAKKASPTFTGTPLSTTAAAGTSTTQIATTAFVDALRDVPQVTASSAYTLALTDRGGHVSNSTGGFVIPANASVAFPIGSTITLYNNSATTQALTITTDTLRNGGTTSTGSRTIAAYGLASVVKVATTTWVVSGHVT